MKNINVVAGVIYNNDLIFATQRGYGEYKDFWEFPGGKIEIGESEETALKRELKEELDIDILILNKIKTVEYDYPNFHLTMHCYKCNLIGKEPTLLEHEDARWLKKENLDTINWLPADLEVVKEIKK